VTFKLINIPPARMLMALAAGTLMASSAYAESPRSVDARTLDIAGVKTGMDYDQALTAVAKHFGVPQDQIKQAPLMGENPVTKTKLHNYFVYEKDGVSLTVHFEPRVPVDTSRPQAVSQVIYEIPWSKDNSQRMAQAALEKYGVQSNAPNDLPFQWCGQPNANPGMGCSMPQQPMLELSQVKMRLTDPTWGQARIKFMQDAQAVKPSF